MVLLQWLSHWRHIQVRKVLLSFGPIPNQWPLRDPFYDLGSLNPVWHGANGHSWIKGQRSLPWPAQRRPGTWTTEGLNLNLVWSLPHVPDVNEGKSGQNGSLQSSQVTCADDLLRFYPHPFCSVSWPFRDLDGRWNTTGSMAYGFLWEERGHLWLVLFQPKKPSCNIVASIFLILY